MKLEGYYFDPPHILGIRPPLETSTDEKNFRHELAAFRWVKFAGNAYTFSPMMELFMQAQGKGTPDDPVRPTFGDMTYAAHGEIYRLHNAKSYAMNEHFFKKLLKTEVKKDIFKLFPTEDWTAYVAYPPGAMMCQNSKMKEPAPVIGAYISVVGPEKNILNQLTGLSAIEQHCKKFLWTTSISGLGNNRMGIMNSYLALGDGLESLDQLLTLNINDSGAVTNPELGNKMLEAAILSCLYLNTGNPDLRPLKPKAQLSKSQLRGLENKGKGQEVEDNYSDDISIPVELVSWGWKKPDEYTKEQWEIPARFNYYHTGKGRMGPIVKHWLPPTIAKRNPDLLKKKEDAIAEAQGTEK